MTGKKPEWLNPNDEAETAMDDATNPVKQKVKCLDFSKTASRKDICEGFYSANEGRFLNMPKSSVVGLSQRVEFNKFSSRSSKCSGQTLFEVPITGLFYDQPDNYASALEQSHSFHQGLVWKNQLEKKKYAKFKLTKDQLQHINFENIEKKQKSVKPKKGRAQRR